MKEMKTLTLPNGVTYEIVDDKARKDIANINNDNNRASAPPITQTASGFTITVGNSADRPLNNLRVFGKTTQTTTSGSNLLDNIGESIVASGVSYTVNDDGSVYAKGTATANAYLTISGNFYNSAVPIPDWLVVGETYTVTDATLYLYKSDGTFVSYTNNTVMIPDGYVYYGVFIMVPSGTTVDKTYYPRINAGTAVLPFESYTGCSASPSPSYPQDLKSVENPSVCVAGANLFDTSRLPSVTKGGVSITNNGNGSLSVTGVGTTTDTCSCEYSISNAEMRLLFHPGKLRLLTNVKTYPMVFVNLYKNDKFYSTIMSSNWGRDYSFELPEEYFESDTYSLRVGMHANSDSTIISGLVIPVLTQHEGNITDLCKAPKTITLQRTLPGIPVTSNSNYIDTNGKRWVCDEIDFKRGVYIKRVNVKTFDGTENWAIGEQNVDAGYLGVFYTAINDSIAASTARCSHYLQGNSVGLIGKAGQFDTYYNQFRVNIADFTTVEEWKTQLADWNDSGNPLTLIYQLAIPVETALSEEELAEFYTLYSHNKNTTVLNDHNAWMRIDYTVDTKSYIDSHMCSGSGNSNAAISTNGIVIFDQATGKPYRVYISNGKLMMDESEDITVVDPGSNTSLKVDETLSLSEDGTLSVNTTDVMESDNTLPITSAGVHAAVGGVETLLRTI